MFQNTGFQNDHFMKVANLVVHNIRRFDKQMF